MSRDYEGLVFPVASAAILAISAFAIYSCDKQGRHDEKQIHRQGFDILEYDDLSGTVQVKAGSCELKLDYHESRGQEPIKLVYDAVGKSFTVTKPSQLRALAPDNCF